MVVIALIVLRLFFLQVIEKKYSIMAQENAIQRKVVYPSRGIVYDRKGRAILDNNVLFDLTVIPSQVKNIDTFYLCQLLGIDMAEFNKRMKKAIIRNSRYRSSVFAPLLPPEIYGRIQENLYQFPGFDLVQRPVRNYPYRVGANIFGYTGEVDSAIMKRTHYFYQLGDFIGYTGLEKSYESVLMGKRGVNYVIRNARNLPIGPYDNGRFDTAAIAGKSLHLALDIKLQAFGEKLMSNKIGAIVAIDPQTGGILALVSSPEFDPNILKGSSRSKMLYQLYKDPTKPLFNRAIMATYPPGSTFKPLEALTALELKVVTPAYGIGCLGAYYGCPRVVKCTEHAPGHAANMRLAIANSCNSYFSQIFRFIIDQNYRPAQGLMQWKTYMNGFGLGRKLGVDLPGEQPGYIPDTSHYNKIFGKGHWNSCTIVSLAIGQGEILETPLQIANSMCEIANHGFYYTPHLVQSIEGDNSLLAKYHIRHQVTRIPDSLYHIVIQGMEDVIDHGTGQSAKIPGIAICGKTGTAQNPHGKDHSLFAAFAPMVNPRIAICVVVENAGWGATWAAPIGSLMIEKYLRDTISTARLPLLEKMEQANLIQSELKPGPLLKLSKVNLNAPIRKGNISGRMMAINHLK